MKTDTLTRLYPALTAQERLSLVLAAGARGDEAEQLRLAQSAPKRCFERSDDVALVRALSTLADAHLIHQLDLVGRIWRWKFFEESQRHRRKRRRAGGYPRLPTPLFCYLLLVFADGWKGFCGELQIDPDVLLTGMPGYRILFDTEAIVRKIGYMAEHALDCEQAILGARNGADDEGSGPPTAEQVAAMYQEQFEKLCKLQ